MERRRETSERHKERRFWLVLAIGALGVWLGMEIKTILSGHISILGLGYILFFTVILIWQYAFRYTCILTDESFIVVSEGVGIRRTFEVKLAQAESFSNKYVKSFFKRTGIKRYVYRYSAFDGRPIRIFVFSENGKMNAVLFRSSDSFINELKKMMPEKFLDMAEKK